MVTDGPSDTTSTTTAESGLWVVIGLGNPGPRFTSSRHNVGFSCVDVLATRHGIPLKERRQHAVLGQGAIEGRQVVLAKPRTFMNLSGRALRYVRDRFGVPPERMLVVYDDMDLPLGKLRLRLSGSSGGHNGLNSIIGELDTQEFPRLRIGIGRPNQPDTIAHVLGGFTSAEKREIAEALSVAADAVEAVLAEGVERAMNGFN